MDKIRAFISPQKDNFEELLENAEQLVLKLAKGLYYLPLHGEEVPERIRKRAGAVKGWRERRFREKSTESLIDIWVQMNDNEHELRIKIHKTCEKKERRKMRCARIVARYLLELQKLQRKLKMDEDLLTSCRDFLNETTFKLNEVRRMMSFNGEVNRLKRLEDISSGNAIYTPSFKAMQEKKRKREEMKRQQRLRQEQEKRDQEKNNTTNNNKEEEEEKVVESTTTKDGENRVDLTDDIDLKHQEIFDVRDELFQLLTNRLGIFI